MNVEEIRQIVRETIESLSYFVMQVDASGVKTHVKSSDGSDWTGDRSAAEALAKRLNKKTLSKRMNLRYDIEPAA